MALLTSAFLFDLESNMRVISENTYLTLSKDQWWRLASRELTGSVTKRERILWLLETGFLEYGVEGQTQFMDLATVMTEYEHQYVTGSGLKMLRSQLEDTDANGVAIATKWARTMGALAANFPQQELARTILANPVTYDGIAYFHANALGTSGHPIDPTNPSGKRFANHFTGAATAFNPGAVPLTGAGAATVDVAQANINKALSYIAGIAQPNGRNPRKLRPTRLFVPPALHYSALLATQSKMIAMGAASGGGGADVSLVVSAFDIEVVKVPEFAASLGGSDTDYYLGCEDVGGELGAFVFSNREPFNITYHGPLTDAQLASKREYEWIPHGRSVVGPGHPYLMFKCSAT
jgi:hypothetical protein